MATVEKKTTDWNPVHFLMSVWDRAGMLLVLFCLFLGCSLWVENFLSPENMKSIGLAVATIGIISCTMLFCLASGDFDLSVGAVVAASGVGAVVAINWMMLAHPGSGEGPAVALGVVTGLTLGAVVGLFNGIVIARFKINALITTLATMQIVRGSAFIITGGRAIGISAESFSRLGTSTLWGIPTPVVITLCCFTVFGLVLRGTTFGRNTLAIGGNAEAARLAGIPVVRTRILIFTLQGLMAGLAGVVLAARMTSGQPKVSEGLELQVISACVLGGVSLTGGIGSMFFVIAGVLIMGIVENAMNLMNVDSFYQYVTRGLILLGAVLLDRVKQNAQQRR